MNRTDFLTQLWKSWLKPLLLFLLITLLIGMLIELFSDKTAVSTLLVIILFFAVIMLAGHLINIVLKHTVIRFYESRSDKTKQLIDAARKVATYCVTLVLGALLYVCWTKDAFMALFFTSYILYGEIRKIIRNEKTIGNSATD
ncbi:MAG: hypothetical protein ACK5Z2_16290 [Bacteroidota bacterium]|jgi:hypothetical protein